jgi:hypothetical protein
MIGWSIGMDENYHSGHKSSHEHAPSYTFSSDQKLITVIDSDDHCDLENDHSREFQNIF